MASTRRASVRLRERPCDAHADSVLLDNRDFQRVKEKRFSTLEFDVLGRWLGLSAFGLSIERRDLVALASRVGPRESRKGVSGVPHLRQGGGRRRFSSVA